MEEEIRVLELYSGIGGMHYALQDADVSYNVAASVDINPKAKTVYNLNFPSTTYWQKNIQGFKAAELEKLNINLVMMSPPCQPFTRIGLQKDTLDPRTESFLHLLKVFIQMKKPPDYILLENVKGFESSKTHEIFVETLENLQYSWQGFLVSPKNLGIPNARLRYYMLAKLRPKSWSQSWHNQATILDYLPATDINRVIRLNGDGFANPSHIKIESYLEKSTNETLKLPQHIVDRYMPVMDLVDGDSDVSMCFTKSYGKYVEGTGSVLKQTLDNGETHLRYFSPREIANLMGFPSQFRFPEEMTNVQKYKLLGNSLNVKVVSHLLTLLLE